jgi:UV DNA damage endonuclease
MYRTGYCCINLTIGESFKTMKLGWANKNPEETPAKWRAIVTHNFKLLHKIIEWNIKNGVFLYRISSDLIPFADHDHWGQLWREALREEWMAIASSPARQSLTNYRTLGGRITIHPGQFVSISSENPETRRKSLANLEYHGQLLDYLGLPETVECPINIHISNGTKGESVVKYVEESLRIMSNSVRNRIVFENEQNGYWRPSNIKKHFRVPITLDYHHLSINPDEGFTLEEIIKFTRDSWPNIDPVQHYSEGRKHALDPAHSDYVQNVPDVPYDIEIEAKAKEKSIMPYLRKRNGQITNVLY